MPSINKQKALQFVVSAIGIVGGLIAAAPQILPAIPEAYQKYGIATIGVAIVVEKILIQTNQILVGPSAVQSPATQAKLAAMSAVSNTPPQA